MLRRHHCLQVSADGITQKVNNEGPSTKRRKLTDLIETPKGPSTDERLTTLPHTSHDPRPSNSRQSVTPPGPVPGTSQHHSLPTVQHTSQHAVRTCSSPLMRFNSNQEQLLTRSRGATIDSAPERVMASSRLVTDMAPTLTSELLQRSVAQQQLLSSFSHSSHVSEQSSHQQQPSILTAVPQSSSSYFTSQFGASSGHPALLSTTYFPLPLTPPSAAADIGCYLTTVPPCLPSMPAVSSDPFLAAAAAASTRPSCPMWPSFSTIGIVPAPMLATDALPGYFSAMHQHHQQHQVPSSYLPTPPSTHFHRHVTAATPLPAVSMPSSVSAPVLVPRTDYMSTVRRSRTVDSLPLFASSQQPPSSSHVPPPPPYQAAVSASGRSMHAAANGQQSATIHHHQQQQQQQHHHHRHQHRHHSPPSMNPYSRYVPTSDWPMSLAEPDPTQPLFVQHFLSMLESTLGAVHSSPHHHPYTVPTFHNYEALLGLARQLSESKPKGMSKADIDRLPSYQYTTTTAAQNASAAMLNGASDDSGCAMAPSSASAAQTSCVVCMCDFVSRQRVRELPCQHIYHTKCIDKWLKTNRTCPLCRCDALDLLNSDDKNFIVD